MSPDTLLADWLAGAAPASLRAVDHPAHPHARGALASRPDGIRLLLVAATPAPSALAADLPAQLASALDALRALGGLANLERYELPFGFRLEELCALRVHYRDASDRDALARWAARIAPPGCAVTLAHDVPPDTTARVTVLAGALRERDDAARTAHGARYARGPDGRVRVEAFELHVVEHCNLRCAQCCNMSPYLPERVMPAAQVEADCALLARHLRADVFKIMGGEPLLHPDITGVLHAIARTQISDTIRLFTNGLLLHRMDDAFWEALDQLTISSYASAPVKPAHLELAREKSARFDVVLNVKHVDRFSEVLVADRRDDDAAVQATYDACWLRHRCLIARGGRFFKCTRAAYFEDFHARVDARPRAGGLGAAPPGGGPAPEPPAGATMARDGVPLDAPDLGERLLAYLDARAPLGACRYCLGSSGPLVPHTQLTKRAVREGAL